LITVLAVGVASATPTPNGAVLNTRIFNDCPTSVLNTTNNYPALISISDSDLSCGGFANLHNWHFSEDGGATDAVFNNGDCFKYSADLTISGAGEGEGGLQVAPWWSQNVDGRFNVRTTDGEIACFGGRLPFYSFTGDQGVTYTKGDLIHLEIVYNPHSNTMLDPATVTYTVVYQSTTYSSPALPFDEGNPAEDPPYGVWGMLNDARVGGYVQCFLQAGNGNAALQADYENITFQPLCPVAVEEGTWSQVKGLYR
jgi:hypothetical protein